MFYNLLDTYILVQADMNKLSACSMYKKSHIVLSHIKKSTFFYSGIIQCIYLTLWSKYKEPQLKYKNWKPAYIVTIHSHCFSLPQKKWTLFLSNIQNMGLIFP